jgi:hypothetical protein
MSAAAALMRGCADQPGLTDRAMDIARRTNDAQARFLALQAKRMEISGAPDQTYVRLALSEEAVRVAQDTGNPELGVWAHGCRLGASWELGLRGQADSELAGLAAAVERVKEPLARWRLEVARGTLALIDGRYSGAVDAAERAAAVERRAGQHLAAGVARVIRHLAAARTGDTDTEDERRSLWPQPT